ncbi:MAG: aspartate aminotransferase family protein [Flavobacteriales bacterium]
MKLFDVYPLFAIEPVKAEGCYVYDSKGEKYLDFYGGHAVISIGHTHPHYVKRVEEQLEKIAFYSNSVIIPIQKQLAEKLGNASGYPDYNLFLINSGAEACENALKLASFHTGKPRIIAFDKAFHGRTSGALQVTDYPKMKSAFNGALDAKYIPLEDLNAVETELKKGDVGGIIIEGIQGVAGIVEPSVEFLKGLRKLADKYDAVLILDEVQSGYGRTGKFFSHQHSGIQADVVTIAKGMGNGFPIGGVLIHPKFKASSGLLGTTFGGNHLACAAALAVLEVMEEENLITNAAMLGDYLIKKLLEIPQVKKITGRGLMIGVLLEGGKQVRDNLLSKHKIFTGGASNPDILRLLPPLNITKLECDMLLEAIKAEVMVNA